jgi:hypothetical protein
LPHTRAHEASRKRFLDALDQVPDTVHFDRKGERMTATLYVGNLEFNASEDDLHKALGELFKKVRLEQVAIPRGNPGYAFIGVDDRTILGHWSASEDE